MKRIKKIIAVFSAIAVIGCASIFTVGAASVSDGLKGDIQATDTNGGETEVTADITNSNYYAINNINYKLTVSDNAEIIGESQKNGITLSENESDSLSTRVALKSKTTQSNAETVPTANQGVISATSATEKAVTVKQPQSTDNRTVKTGNDFSFAVTLSVVILFAALLIIVLKKRGKKALMSLVLTATLTASCTAVGISTLSANAAEEYSYFTDVLQIKLGNESVTVTLTVEYPKQAEIHDNTLAGIQKLNNNQAEVIYNDNGEITFISGKFTDYKVTNADTAFSSLQAVETLLGAATYDFTLLPVKTNVDTITGDTYYNFEQFYNNYAISSSYVVVGADKDGNTISLASSLDKNLSDDLIGVDTSKLISSEDAINTALEALPNLELSEVRKPELVIDSDFKKYCWYVYVNNQGTEGSATENFSYLKITVDAINNKFLSYAPLASIESDNAESYDTDLYFKNVETEMMDYTAADGSTVKLPTAKKANGKYQIIDTKRKIYTAEPLDTEMSNITTAGAYTFDNPEDVPANVVSFVDNIIKTYDYFKSKGITSTDGNGIPIKIYMGYYKASDGQEVANAVSIGNTFGFSSFICSDTPVSRSLDVAAHEYTHSFRATAIGSLVYSNITGALEESYADIMGNLTEMSINPEGCDTKNWLVGESRLGTAFRSMSNPEIYGQPSSVGGPYFYYSGDVLSKNLDNGGVHINSGVLNNIAFNTYNDCSYSYEEWFDIWLNSCYVGVADFDLNDVRGYVRHIAKRHGFNELYNSFEQEFENANAINTDTLKWNGFQNFDGYKKAKITVNNLPSDCDIYGVIAVNIGTSDDDTVELLLQNSGKNMLCKEYNITGESTLRIVCERTVDDKTESSYLRKNFGENDDLSNITVDYSEFIS